MILDVRVGWRAFWKRDAGGRMLRALPVGFAAALALMGCASRELRSGDETHFLHCHVDADCSGPGASYRCEKGLCVVTAAQTSRSSDAGNGAAQPPSATSMPIVAPSSMPGEVGGGSASHSDARAPMVRTGNPPGDIGDGGPTPSGDAEIPPTGSDAANLPPHLLVEFPGFITATAIDDTSLYFVTESTGTPPGSFFRVPKDGSTPIQVLATAPTFVDGLAVDDEFLYYTDLDASTVNRLPKSGGQPQVIATGQTRPWGIAVDGAAVYWVNQGANQAGVPNTGASVMALRKEASQPVMLAANEQMCFAIVLDGAGGIIWQNGPNGSTNGALRRLVLPSGTPTSLASGLDLTSAPAIAGGRMFWSNPSGFGTPGTLQSVSLDGGMVATPLTLGPGNGAEAVPVAADRDAVYIAAALGGLNDGTLWKFSLANGALSLISGPVSATPAGGPGINVGNRIVSLLSDPDALYAFEYWADGAGTHGRVRSAPKTGE